MITYLFSEHHSQKEATLFRKLLYAFVMVKCLYWFFDFDLLFGENSIVFKNNVQLSPLKSLAFILFNGGSPGMAYGFLIITIVFAIYGVMNSYFPRITAFVVWFSVINIDNAIYPTLTGGDFLLQQLLFFNIFLSGFKMNYTEAQSEIDKAVHNIGMVALKCQLCLVYLMAALAKLTDADWQNGTALSQTFLIHDFSLPILYDDLDVNVVVLKLLSYIIIAYQLMFPLLIWVERWKKWFLAFGVLQHVFIALFMGLPTFGFIMIIAYSIFYVPAFKSKNSF